MSVTRREILAAAAMVTAVAGTRLSAATRGGLMLVDPALPEQSRHIARGHGGARRITVQEDFVRQWRDGLEGQIVAASGALALVRWDKALLLSGLARESGLRTRQQRLGRSVILVAIDRA